MRLHSPESSLVHRKGKEMVPRNMIAVYLRRCMDLDGMNIKAAWAPMQAGYTQQLQNWSQINRWLAP